MMKIKHRPFGSKRGFTLVEASAAVTITVLVMGIAIGGFMYTLKNTNESDVQSELDIDVQLAMERLKMDLRLSSLDEIFYYPAGPGPYTALSFPMAEDSDGDGLFELDATGKIIWDKTVVYHIWPSSPHQLRVTTFTNRDNDLTDTQRQAQLESVVKNGHGNDTYNGGNASSHMIFENLLDWSISPKRGIFDAYSPITERESTSLGFALLDDGSHTFQFEVVNKNADSSGYKIGIDQLTVSPSYGEREAEDQLPVSAQSGATAVSQYIPSGSWKGNHQLYFPATAVGQSFTLSMDNDRWEETNFDATGCIASNTLPVFDEGLSPKDFVVRLEGMEKTWEAALQTGDEYGSAPTKVMKNKAIRIMQKGSDLTDGGNWLKCNGRKCQVTFAAATNADFKVLNAYIGQSVSGTNASMDYLDPSQVKPILFSGPGFSHRDYVTITNGGTATSDWIDLPINKTNNYLVSFRIADDGSLDSPKQWTDVIAVQDGTALTTMVVENAGSAIENDTSWSGRADITPYLTNCVFGLESITASYADSGTFSSQIFDTRLDAPTYGEISLNADVPSGTTLATKVRSGNQPDLSDASDWNVISSSSTHPRSISASYKRYIQFQAEMTSSIDGLSTPKLKDVTIDWTGDMQLVNIGATMTKGPDYGVMQVLVDGVPLQSALSVDLMIYKDIYSLNKTTKRITSSLIADIRPRNTGH